jgi:hypothetical protein
LHGAASEALAAFWFNESLKIALSIIIAVSLFGRSAGLMRLLALM